jgi:hypothetical protein
MNDIRHLDALARLPEPETEHVSQVAPRPPSTIYFTELPEDNRGDAAVQEWNFYRREVARLLAEGQKGNWVLIKGEQIIGIWGSRDEAAALALERYLNDPV